MDLKSIINHSVYNNHIEIKWNLSEIYGDISKNLKILKYLHKNLELVIPR